MTSEGVQLGVVAPDGLELELFGLGESFRACRVVVRGCQRRWVSSSRAWQGSAAPGSGVDLPGVW